MVPFESWGTISYSPSTVTMAVSLAISKIFNVKERPGIEIWVWGHSRSLTMARFDRPCMTFYGFANFAIITIGLSCTFSSYLTLNNIMNLKCGLEVTQGH